MQARRRNLFVLLVVFVLALALAGLVARSAFRMYGKYTTARKVLEGKQVEYASMNERSAYLERELALLATPEGLEAGIRRKFSVAREGEEVIVIISPDTDNKINELSPDKKSWLNKIWTFLNPFGK
jgi:cell division protein FtsB